MSTLWNACTHISSIQPVKMRYGRAQQIESILCDMFWHLHHSLWPAQISLPPSELLARLQQSSTPSLNSWMGKRHAITLNPPLSTTRSMGFNPSSPRWIVPFSKSSRLTVHASKMYSWLSTTWYDCSFWPNVPCYEIHMAHVMVLITTSCCVSVGLLTNCNKGWKPCLVSQRLHMAIHPARLHWEEWSRERQMFCSGLHNKVTHF